MIDLIKEHILLVRLGVFITGFLGFLLFKKIRPEFFKNRNMLWWSVTIVLYFFILGPAILLFSLIALIGDKILNRRK